jgi:hypothetical protein
MTKQIRRKLNIKIIKKEFKDVGYTLLSKTFKTSHKKLLFKCNKEHNHYITYNSFHTGQRCGKCFGPFKYTLKEVRQFFKQRNWILISKRYKDNLNKLNVKCDKGHKIKITLAKFLFGQGCRVCYLNRNKGKTSYTWKKNLSNSHRFLSRGFLENGLWTKNVFKLYNYKCVVCGKNTHDLNAHHLEGYHWCKELRFEVTNGVVLCRKHHNKFHKKFRRKWNTSQQFYKFLRSFR